MLDTKLIFYQNVVDPTRFCTILTSSSHIDNIDENNRLGKLRCICSLKQLMITSPLIKDVETIENSFELLIAIGRLGIANKIYHLLIFI